MTDHSAETPMSSERLEAIRERHQLEWIERPDRVIGEPDDPWCGECGEQHPCEPARLLDEVDRLRAEAVQHAEDRDAYVSKMIDRYNALAEETARLRAENEVLKAAPEIIANPAKAGKIASLVQSSTKLVQIERDDARRERDALAAELDRANEVARGWEATAAQHYLRLVEYREERDELAAKLDAALKLRCCVCNTSLGYTNHVGLTFCGPCANGETPAPESPRPPSALHDQSDEHTSPVPEEG